MQQMNGIPRCLKVATSRYLFLFSRNDFERQLPQSNNLTFNKELTLYDNYVFACGIHILP